MRTKVIYILLVAALMCGCADDERRHDMEPQGIVLGLASSGMPDAWMAEQATRAEGDIAAATPNDIGVWAYSKTGTNAEAVFGNVRFYSRAACPDNILGTWTYDGNDWPYAYDDHRNWTYGASYKFYACSPHAAGASTDGGYDDFSTLTWEDIPMFAVEDYLYADRMVKCHYPDNDGTLHAYGGKKIVVPFNMKHLMARLRFCFKLHDKFGDLRKIVLKKMAVVNPDIRTRTLSIGLGGSAPVLTWSAEFGTGAAATLELRNDPGAEDGITLTKANNSVFQPFASLYVLPDAAFSSMDITVTYDVLDLKDQLLRKDETATSKLSFSRALQDSKYYNINIIVNPDFLYSLSDNDPGSDGTITISSK